MLRVEVISTFAGFLSLKGSWDRLLALSGERSLFLTFEWARCCLEHAAADEEIAIHLVRNDAELLGIFPLVRKKVSLGGLPVTLLTLIGENHAFRSGFILRRPDRAIVDFLITRLREIPRSFDLLILDAIEKGSATDVTISEALARHRMMYFEIAGGLSPFIAAEKPWEEYAASLSRLFRNKLRRIENYFQKRGGCTVARAGRDDLDTMIARAGALARKNGKQRLRSSLTGGFYRSLATLAREKGWLNLWLLSLDGKPAAFTYNLVYGGKIFALLSEYDPQYRSLSPDGFLNLHAVRDCFAKGYAEYDWPGAYVPSTMKWTPYFRRHCKYLIFNTTIYGKILYLWKSSVATGLHHLLTPRSKTGASLPEPQPSLLSR